MTWTTKRTGWNRPVCCSCCLSKGYNTSTRSGNWLAGSKSSRGQCLEVRCKISTLKPAAESSLCQLSSWSKSSDFSALSYCFSWSFLRRISFTFVLSWSSFSLSRPLVLSTSQSPQSSRPRSKDFLAFVGPWPPARSEFTTVRFILQEVT